MSEQIEILGRQAKIVPPGPQGKVKATSTQLKPHARVHVNGLNKADGKPIRFHSVKSAENHIRNFRLEQ